MHRYASKPSWHVSEWMKFAKLSTIKHLYFEGIFIGAIVGKTKSTKYETSKYTFEFSHTCVTNNKWTHILSLLVSFKQ